MYQLESIEIMYALLTLIAKSLTRFPSDKILVSCRLVAQVLRAYPQEGHEIGFCHFGHIRAGGDPGILSPAS